MHLLNKPNEDPHLPGLDTVQGEIILRNGVFSTDKSLKYTLQGVYLWRSGLVFLVANPTWTQPVVEDYLIEIDRNSTLLEALQVAEQMALNSRMGNIF